MTAHYRLPASSIDALVWGDGDALQTLRSAQLSRRLLLLRAVVRTATEQAPEQARTARLASALELLAWAQRHAPLATADVLCYPLVGAWLQRCLRRLRGVVAALPSGPLWSDLAGFGAIAATAAVRSGREFTAEVAAPGGVVVLPSLGRAVLRSGDTEWVAVSRDRERARFTVGPHEVRLPGPDDDPDPAAPGWHSLRPLRARHEGQALELLVDDLDPARDCYGFTPSGRLGPADLKRWADLLDGAWRTLVRHGHRHTSSLRAGLTVLVPLAPDKRHDGVSASARAAFGAMALTEPTSPLALCVSLIHELRHSLLNGILDLGPLYDAGHTDRYYSPWRSDPRPMGGLLHGAYAFLGVADFWRVQRTVAVGGDRSRAEYEFAHNRDKVRQALDTLLGSGRLTGLGESLVRRMAIEVDSWADACPSAGPTSIRVRRALTLHQITWRLRNIRVDPTDVDTMTRAWLVGRHRPADVPRTTLADGVDVEFADSGLHPTPAGGVDAPLFKAMAALDRGDFEASARHFRRVLAADPASLPGWSGLVLCLRHLAGEPAARTLRMRPELVFAVCHRAWTLLGHVPDPVAVAAWLAQPAIGPANRD
jgi:HEXXH motif-containing protein